MVEISVKFLSSAMHVKLLMSKSLLHVDKKYNEINRFEQKLYNNYISLVG